MTDPATELQRMWDVLPIAEDGPIHLRGIHYITHEPCNMTFSAADFPSLQERQDVFAQEALRLNDAGYNIYTCLNPIKPDFIPDGWGGVKDSDILRRHRLLIDLDRAANTKVPATQEDIDAAMAVADRISGYLAAEQAATVFRVMSGNGVHLYLPLDLPNDEVATQSCRDILRGLNDRFGTDLIRVDTSVFNASRITKVPGTIARKGQEAAGRPYWKAVVL